VYSSSLTIMVGMADGKGTPTPEQVNEAPTRDQVSQSQPWTLRQFGGKTVWDWMELLIVPFALAVIGFLFTMQQDARQQRSDAQRAESERRIQQQNAQDEALQAYLDQMTQLILDRKLLEADEDDPVYTLAQARTSTVISRLDAAHNRNATRFLSDSGLAETTQFGAPSVSLFRDIDLSGADLRGVTLVGADLSNAELQRATLIDAFLDDANLSGADLSGANLSDAILSEATLTGGTLLSEADLSGANLSEANLSDASLYRATLIDAFLGDANLSGARLEEADLSGADLSGADLSEADLSGAKGVTEEELEEEAETLEGTTLPNGQRYEDWLKTKEDRALPIFW
jgi:uncharacterized protein YjbI with pentapeptide repeats